MKITCIKQNKTTTTTKKTLMHNYILPTVLIYFSWYYFGDQLLYSDDHCVSINAV